MFVGRRVSNASFWLGCNDGGEVTLFLRSTTGGTGLVRDTNLESAIPINDGQWHHVVAVRDGSTGQNTIYIDGVARGSSTTLHGGNFYANTNVTIGYFNNGFYFPGSLDEVAIHNVALSAAEVQADYNAGQGGDYCALTAPGGDID